MVGDSPGPSSIKIRITHYNIILTLSILVFRQRHDLLAADSRPAAPHLELVFADYADLECGQSCLEYVSLLPPPLPHIQQLLQIQLCHTFTVRKVKLL